MKATTIGHGTRPLDRFVECLVEACTQTLVDVRRYPGSRRNPQFNQSSLATALRAAGIEYRHAIELGGMLSDEPGEEDFGCVSPAAFRSYAARMRTERWQAALDEALSAPEPCFMCAESDWRRCHRSLIAELIAARGGQVVHLGALDEGEEHRPRRGAEYRDGRLYLCGALVA